jgi:threonine dehydrogenase-like Zn-dependent dehydrogenase
MAARTLPLDSLITTVEPLDRLPEVFHELEKQPGAMKVLIRCGNP